MLIEFFQDWLKFGPLDTSCVPAETGKIAHIANALKKQYSLKSPNSFFFNYRCIILAVYLAMLQLKFNVVSSTVKTETAS